MDFYSPLCESDDCGSEGSLCPPQPGGEERSIHETGHGPWELEGELESEGQLRPPPGAGPRVGKNPQRPEGGELGGGGERGGEGGSVWAGGWLFTRQQAAQLFSLMQPEGQEIEMR